MFIEAEVLINIDSKYLVVLSNSSPLLVKILISMTLVPPILVRSLVPVTNVDFVFTVFKLKRLFLDQFSSLRVLSQSLEHSLEVSVYGEDKLSRIICKDAQYGQLKTLS